MRGFTSEYGAPPIPIPAPTPANPGELVRLSVPGPSGVALAEVERSCAVRLKAAADIVRVPEGGVVVDALEGGNGDGVRAIRLVLIDRGDVAAGYSGGVPYVFIDVTDSEEDPKPILRGGFGPVAPTPGRVVVLSDAGAETLRKSDFGGDDPGPSSSDGAFDREG